MVDGPDVPADVPVEGVLAAVVADADEEGDGAGLVAVVTLPTDVDGLGRRAQAQGDGVTDGRTRGGQPGHGSGGVHP